MATAAMVGLAQAQVRLPIAPIRTDAGFIAGQVLPSGVRAWLGVPYAQPPTQQWRWQAPRPIHWKGVWHADRTMPECIQVLRPHNINHYFGEEPTSENCLYLNVWAPPGSRSGSRLPVIVFIYGGAFTIGSSGSALYDGEQLARHGAVFVNFNYRLGILGFLSHPELSREQSGHSGNYGYLDQNAALKWVHKNIVFFGGDPDRVLLAGQSAGATSVTAQIFSPLSKGLFQSAFMASGCRWGGNVTALSAGEATGLVIQNLLHAANVGEMRKIPADRILSLQAENQILAHNAGVRVDGVIDGYFTPLPQMTMLEEHQINDVPIMATSTHEDLDYASSPLVHASTIGEYESIAYKLYGDVASDYLNLFPVTDDSKIKEVAGSAAREAGMQGDARRCAQLQATYTRSPTYLGLFKHQHPYAIGVMIADQDISKAGAYHTSDLPYWFGTLDAFNMVRITRNWRPSDRQLSNDMMNVLSAFARNGRPSTAQVAWPPWSSSLEQEAVIGETVSVELLDGKRMDWMAAHPAAQSFPPDPERVRARD